MNTDLTSDLINDLAQDITQELIGLRKSKTIYEDILNKVMQGVYIVNAKGQIVWFNDLMQEVDGVNREEVLGIQEELVWEYINFKAGTAADTIQTGKPSEEKLLLYPNKKGRKVGAFMQSYPVYFNDKLEYIFILIFYMDHSEKILNRISEYRNKFSHSKTRMINDTVFTLDDVLGGSQQIRNLVANARKVAVKNSAVLLCGQTGTGKEIFAQGIHNASLYQKGRFVAINCATIPENLLETILFGSVKGAFTGALDKPGLLEEARDGTLFLDELDSLPLAMQSKLLRVLQEKQACRIGDNRNYPINCRIISATNQDPQRLIARGILRQDLYFRLAVVTLEIPPLADRKEDIPELVAHFLKAYNAEYDLQIKTIDDAVFDIFFRYSWPGNVRELEHVIEYMMNFTNAQFDNLSTEDLPSPLKELLRVQGKKHEYDLNAGSCLNQALEEYEKKLVQAT
ncbi:MAG TPA: sigma 54-interacting transcriptional regulator, partial [Syntrophomonas sp.]|nr:sigma 54-interacting transcriptional regulator [Syntrophomonas sp.]